MPLLEVSALKAFNGQICKNLVIDSRIKLVNIIAEQLKTVWDHDIIAHSEQFHLYLFL